MRYLYDMDAFYPIDLAGIDVHIIFASKEYSSR